MDDSKIITLEFRQLVETAGKILITSHISPDPDAVTSALLVGRTLKYNFPEKDVQIVLEEEPARKIDFLDGYDEIKFKLLLEAVAEFQPDLIILVDAAGFDRVSRVDGVKLRQLINSRQIKTAIIDHHEQHGRDDARVYINNQRPATAQEAYELLFEELNFQKPRGYAETTLLGIISDTARHKFDNPIHRQTYRVVSDLIDAGASIEKLEAKMDRYDVDQLMVLNNLISNITDSDQGYTYSFIDDKLSQNWLISGKSVDSFKLGLEEFTNRFLKNFQKNYWGFAVYMEMVGQRGFYGVSFRSVSGVKDVSKIAYMLGGGGHKAAAGAKFEASSVEAAIERVKAVISGADDED